MSWHKIKSFLPFLPLLLCSGFFSLEARPERIHSSDLISVIEMSQKKEIQLFILSDESLHVNDLTNYNTRLLSVDMCIKTMSQNDINSLFSFDQLAHRSPISLVCIRLPTKEEESTGFCSFRITFVEEDSLTSLIQREGSALEAFHVLSLIRE